MTTYVWAISQYESFGEPRPIECMGKLGAGKCTLTSQMHAHCRQRHWYVRCYHTYFSMAMQGVVRLCTNNTYRLLRIVCQLQNRCRYGLRIALLGMRDRIHQQVKCNMIFILSSYWMYADSQCKPIKEKPTPCCMCQLSGKPETIHVVTVLLIMHAGSKIFVQLSCWKMCTLQTVTKKCYDSLKVAQNSEHSAVPQRWRPLTISPPIMDLSAK